jgi:glycosyltransferase involved in cell wall biosynthesis
MCCPVIFGEFGATREFMFDGALSFGGTRTGANYSDKGFDDVGEWWEPKLDQVTCRLFEAHDMGAATYSDVAASGVQMIRAKYTWRASAMSLRAGLAKVQARSSSCSERIVRAEWKAAGLAKKVRIRAINSLRRVVNIAKNIRERYNAARSLERVAPPGILPWLFHGLSRRSVRKYQNMLALLPLPRGERQDGILFIGYVEANLGIAESQRNMLNAITDRNVNFGIFPISAGVETRIVQSFMAEKYDRRNRYAVNVIEAAADQVPVIFRNLGPRRTFGTYNVLRTYWELPTAPREWQRFIRDIDEIWTPNKFVQRAFKSIFDGPIIVMPPCVLIEPPGQMDEDTTLPKRTCFEFFFSFDYYSSPYRKNPLGVIAAFREAFPPDIQDVALLIKSTGAPDHYPDIKSAIRRAINEDRRIRVIDRTLPRGEMIALMRRCDCYVSLHRAEGFGLGMVEAMMLGKAVIGTAYSGSADFLNDETGFPVPYVLREIQPHEYVWTEGQMWAEPDHASAVIALRKVYEDHELRARRAKAGQALASALFSRERAGRAVEQRYEEIKKKTRGTAA